MQSQIASYSSSWYSYALLLWGLPVTHTQMAPIPFGTGRSISPAASATTAPIGAQPHRHLMQKPRTMPCQHASRRARRPTRLQVCKVSASKLQEQDCRGISIQGPHNEPGSQTGGQTNLASRGHATIAHFERPLLRII